MTINKAHGQTCDKLGIYLPGPVSESVMDSYTSLHFQELSHLKTFMLIFVKQPHRVEETRNI